MATPDKRKLTEDNDPEAPVTKMAKLGHKSSSAGQYLGSGSTNDFMVGDTFQKFRQIFDKIDCIEVRQPDSPCNNQKPITEKCSFDLWSSLDSRQCQFKGPDFRLIVK